MSSEYSPLADDGSLKKGFSTRRFGPSMARHKILVVDDEDLIRWSIRQKLTKWGYSSVEADSLDSAQHAFDRDPSDLILLDVRLPDGSGLDFLRTVRERSPDTIVIMMTAYGVLADAIEALRLGAYDFVAKPLEFEELERTIQNALDALRLRTEVRLFREQDKRQSNLDNIIGESESLRRASEVAAKIAASPTSTVLLQGESGTGKDLFAKAIHYHSVRADHPFMAINCAAIPETLFESELFGHEKGAFTDARSRKQGLFELADGGTLFLDEVGEMPQALQAKLLRVLEEQRFRRVGGVEDVEINVRIVAATNRPLKTMVDDGHFRQDLFYRLNVISLVLPPLRERGDDVLILAEHFIDQYNRTFSKNIEGLAPETAERMKAYAWPGNVRELRNVIERVMILEDGPRIPVDALPIELVETPSEAGRSRSLPGLEIPPSGTSLEGIERELIRLALSRTQGNQTQAAGLLEISRDTLRYKMKKHHLQ